MPIKRYKPEQIATMLRQIEVSIANGKPTPQACDCYRVERTSSHGFYGALLHQQSVASFGLEETRASRPNRKVNFLKILD